jgi:hypothetical protein
MKIKDMFEKSYFMQYQIEDGSVGSFLVTNRFFSSSGDAWVEGVKNIETIAINKKSFVTGFTRVK